MDSNDFEGMLEKSSFLQKKINEKRPFDKDNMNQLKKFYKCEATWSSNAVEGNSISLNETQMILEHGITVHGHTLNEINECIGHGKAFDCMFKGINDKTITEDYIKKLHYLFASNIENIPCPGEYRDVSKTFVMITGSSYPCPDYSEIPEKMKDLVSWSNDMRGSMHPVELAAETHRRFVYIHPFPDGNGRVARLLMNTILLQEHYLPVLITPKTRKTYIAKLENGRISPTDFDMFITRQEIIQQERLCKSLNIEIPNDLRESDKRNKRNISQEIER